ncbi:MAG: type II/IV secretion system ATPase subunit [Nitrosopumilaceae archaeon]|nr:type II/IV secretion system ATPase subunit [Nitrosopumilaceae archaeon]
MNDDNIEEITAERFDRTVGVIHRKFTEFNILDSNVLFGSEDVMNSYIQRIIQRTGHSVTAAAPVMNAMTLQGDRITVTYEREVSLPGPTIDIRKFTRQPYTITHLLELGAMSRLMAAYLWVLFDAKAFETTAINSLMCLTNPRWKIVSIEETPELKIPHYRWERLFTRTSSMISDSANYDITIMDLIKASLRMRPDFEIVGEVRGEEAFALFQSAATGHGGLTSFHASSVESALGRLSAEPINIRASQQMLLWFVLHITRMRNDKKQIVRRVASISEVIPRHEGRVELDEIFRYDIKKNSFGTETLQELIKKSQRLQQAADLLNIDNLQGDLKTRMYLIEQCLKNNAKKIDDVFAILGRYYSWTE